MRCYAQIKITPTRADAYQIESEFFDAEIHFELALVPDSLAENAIWPNSWKEFGISSSMLEVGV